MGSPIAEDLVNLEDLAEEKWYECTQADWKEAFQHHPKIGNIQSLKEKYSDTKEWASNEQSGVEAANDNTLAALAEANEMYEKKFGYIFIVCATGKSAAQMLDILNSRLPNDEATEIQIAAEEQLKITKLRLEKLFL
jgi:2-oxo-4-hydroxy-4-carboxy-5-ureidoimidazoline decarboxylase